MRSFLDRFLVSEVESHLNLRFDLINIKPLLMRAKSRGLTPSITQTPRNTQSYPKKLASRACMRLSAAASFLKIVSAELARAAYLNYHAAFLRR